MPKSKVNHKVFSIPKSILLTGKTLQFLSPWLAAKFAFKLFMTPYKFVRPKREEDMYVNATKKMHLIPELGKKIRVYEYGNSNKKVLLVHGWAGRGTQLYKIAASLKENGFMTISFDGTGHGGSEGKTSSMPEFIASMLELENQYGQFEYVIGHSLGGMALLNAIKKGLHVKKGVIIGSGNSITALCEQFIDRLGLKPKVAVILKNIMDKQLGEDTEVLSAYVAAKSVKTPILVIHDKDDADVPVACAHDINKNLINSEIMITEGLGHRRILIDTKVIEKILEFIKN
ncbi:MAG TPA: alpha/beta hydrolase [Lutibacter sp.]|nr:alpha/beta hydrolase [Lutibacter sp.]